MSAPDASRPSSLVLRLLSSAVFIPILLLANSLGGLPFIVFVMVIIGPGMYEFYRMAEAKGIPVPKLLGVLSGLFLCLALAQPLCPGPRFPPPLAWLLVSSLALMLSLLILITRPSPASTLMSLSALLGGVVYIAAPLGCFLLLRGLGEKSHLGWSYALLPYALTWFCDTFAYGVGAALGRHKLASVISPNKTVEGSIGGILGAVTAGFLSKLTFASYLSWVDAVALGVLVGIFGQVGDLVESAMKRDARIKDSSRIIPGHGGALDRFDSFIFTVPLIYFYLRFFVV